MSIFSALTGGPARTAANAQRDLYGNLINIGGQFVGGGQQMGLDYLTGGRDAAINTLNTGVGTARGDITTGGNQAIDYLNTGTGMARGDLTNAGNAYAPLEALAGNYGRGTSSYMDALGLNGPEGVARARSAFQTGPGFDFQLNTGLDAINRARNARGMANSGNTDRAAQEYGQGLANQEWNNYLTNLGSFRPYELGATSGAASGRAGVSRDLANVDLGYGRTAADISGNTGRSLAQLALTGGTTGAGIEQGFGNNVANFVNTGTGQRLGLLTDLGRPYGQTYGDQAAAEMGASGNVLGLGMNLLRLGAGGGFGGLGGNLSGVGNVMRGGFPGGSLGIGGLS